MTVGELTDQMGKSGVLGAGKLYRAVKTISTMFQDPDYRVFLSVAGPLVPGGLRKVFSDLIADEFIDVIILSGGNIVHDLMEAYGESHFQGSFCKIEDTELSDRGIGRIGDILINTSSFEVLEKKVWEILDKIPSEKRKKGLSIKELLLEIGKTLEDPFSIIRQIYEKDILVFSPGIMDSMLGLNLWSYFQLKPLKIDHLIDLNELANIVYEAKRVGAIILGGGLPKHFGLGANILRDGIDSAVQITLDRPEGGSMSGAPLEEAISWKKAAKGGEFVTVVGDVTILFPLIIASVREKLRK